MELQIGIGGAVVSPCVSIGPYTFLRERGANRLARLKVVWLKRERNGPPKRRIYATATNEIVRGMNIFFFPRKLDALDSSLGGFALASENCGGVQQAVRNPCDLRHFRNVVHAHDVRPAQNAGGDGRGCVPHGPLGAARVPLSGPRRAPETPPPTA